MPAVTLQGLNLALPVHTRDTVFQCSVHHHDTRPQLNHNCSLSLNQKHGCHNFGIASLNQVKGIYNRYVGSPLWNQNDHIKIQTFRTNLP